MKSFRFNKRHPKYLERKEKLRMRSAKGVAARELNRLARHAGESPRAEWRGVHEHTITFCNRITGEMHSVDLFRGSRRDQFRAEVDGIHWRTISATQLGKLVRDKFKPHIQDRN